MPIRFPVTFDDKPDKRLAVWGTALKFFMTSVLARMSPKSVSKTRLIKRRNDGKSKSMCSARPSKTSRHKSFSCALNLSPMGTTLLMMALMSLKRMRSVPLVSNMRNISRNSFTSIGVNPLCSTTICSRVSFCFTCLSPACAMRCKNSPKSSAPSPLSSTSRSSITMALLVCLECISSSGKRSSKRFLSCCFETSPVFPVSNSSNFALRSVTCWGLKPA
mmetsp:Transcript_26084/g.60869  ORF Transcript_26084/g.60869 Transcript_26084/m.60869 type:complete len:219 (-) Transcript_26084:3014-3670(-)